MSEDYDSIVEIEHATAVAAAAFAVKSIEESAISDMKRADNETGDKLVKIKSKKEDTTVSKPEAGRISKLFSGAGLTKSTQEDQDSRVPVSTSTYDKIPQKTILPAPSIRQTPTSDAILPAPSMKKTSTFPDKPINGGGIKAGTSAPKLDLPTTTKPAAPSNEIKWQSAARSGVVKTKADEWEEAEMAKLNKRYEQQTSTILDWENKKKRKSKLRLEKREREIEKRRLKALGKYNNEMEFITNIAEGARAQAEEKHRNKVLKVKEKTNTLRRTGEEAPSTGCCCC
ncbi:remorin [Argentina anserina]|uniref:remorin n=1 Tax=Argentina anserina TaxID=57926 RepID=UPI00217658F5|nr:remorin [Potentilla anserina]